jgi:hypothetical protein
LRDIVRALLAPPILWRDPATGKDTASRFISRAMVEVTPEVRVILETDVSHLRRFILPLARNLPHFSEAQVCWALHFAVSTLHHCTDIYYKRIAALSDGQCETSDVREILELATRFAVGGIENMGGRGDAVDRQDHSI